MRAFDVGYIGDSVKTNRYGVILMICDRFANESLYNMVLYVPPHSHTCSSLSALGQTAGFMGLVLLYELVCYQLKCDTVISPHYFFG
jgi:hypothetical protein